MITSVHVKTGHGPLSRDYFALNKVPSRLPEDIERKIESHFQEWESDNERQALGGGNLIAAPGFILNIRMHNFQPFAAQTFLELYGKNYNQCRDEKPEEYGGERADVLARMYNAIVNGTFNKDGEAFKRTCKQLKIKHTYKAIEAYLKGEA